MPGEETPAAAGGRVRALLEDCRFEVVPVGSVLDRVRELPKVVTLTVTCSPRKGIDATLGVAEALRAEGRPVVPHVAARLVRDRAHLGAILRRLRDAGIEDVFVVGGDSPQPAGRYPAAGRLLADAAEIGLDGFRVGIGAYPDGHPLIEAGELWRALAAKQAYAAYMVTQICFDPGAVGRWLGEARRRGVGLPVYVGVPGVVNRRKLLEISLRVGVGASVGYLTRHGAVVTRLLGRGSYRPDAFVAGLAGPAGGPAAGLAGLHLNTFNQVQATERWRERALAAWGGGAP